MSANRERWLAAYGLICFGLAILVAAFAGIRAEIALVPSALIGWLVLVWLVDGKA